MLTACMLGGQFLIVTFASALCGWYRDCVAMHRLESRCAGVVALDRSFGSLEDARETNWPALVDSPTKRLRSATPMLRSSPARRSRALRTAREI